MECYKAKCFFERQNNGKNEALSQEKSKFDKLEKCHARPFLEAIVFFSRRPPMEKIIVAIHEK